MTWTTDLQTYGSGSLSYRLSIFGLPYDAVSTAEQATSATSPPRLIGLNCHGQKVSTKVDLGTWKTTGGGMRFTFVDAETATAAYSASGANPWTSTFGRRPSHTSWLTADVGVTGDVTISDATGFASSGRIWLDGECISYASIVGSTFTTCTRGFWNTIACAHYTADGAFQRSPEVTDWPVSLEGMRCVLYAYSENDSPTGDGTAIWRGVIRSEPSWNGTAWTLSADSILSVLDQEVAADLGAPLNPRGISYPGGQITPIGPDARVWAYPNFTLAEGTTADAGSGWGARCDVTLASAGAFYETQEDFCAALQGAVDTAVAGSITAFNGTWYVVPDGADGWHMEYFTNGATPRYPHVLGGRSGPNISPIDPWLGFPATDAFGTAYTLVVASSRYYFFPQNAEGSVVGAGTVPRGIATWPRSSVYLDGTTTMPPVQAWAAEKGDFAGIEHEIEGTLQGGVESQDASARSVSIRVPCWLTWTREAKPAFRFGRSLNWNLLFPNAIGDLLNRIQTASPTYATIGGMPLLSATDGDLSVLYYSIDGGSTSWLPQLSARKYAFWSPQKLIEIITEELKIAGYVLTLSATGTYTAVKMRFAAASELPTASSITAPLTDKALATYERAGFGIYNTLQFQDGYDAFTDKRTGDIFVVRDVASFGRSASVRKMSVKPLSAYDVRAGAVSVDQVMEFATSILGILGQPYALVTVETSLLYWGTVVGDVVAITDAHLPADDGTKGITDVVGIVIGREWALSSARMTWTILLATSKIGGYAPACLVTANLSKGGNTYELTCDNTLLPSGAPQASSWFKVNDRVRIMRYGNATATALAGIVTVSASSTITVTFDGVWTPSTDTWVLTIAENDDASLAARQKNFVHVALSTGAIGYASGTLPGFKFGP